MFKWEERKGWDVLLSAFLEEFSSAEPVSLTLLTHPYHGDGDFSARMHAWATETFGVPGARIVLRMSSFSTQSSTLATTFPVP